MLNEAIKSLLHGLGGPAHVARKLYDSGYPPITGDAITLWHLRGKVPFKWRAPVKQLADQSEFKLTEEQERALSLLLDFEPAE